MEEEILVLESIYGENFKFEENVIYFSEDELYLTILIPELYPSNCMDIDFSISLSGSQPEYIYKTLRDSGNKVLSCIDKDDKHKDNLSNDEGILWSLIEAIRESWQQLQNNIDNCNHTDIENNFHEEEEDANEDKSIFKLNSVVFDVDEELAKKIVHGEPIIFKKSTFQAHLCPCNSLQDVAMFKAILLMNNKIKRGRINE